MKHPDKHERSSAPVTSLATRSKSLTSGGASFPLTRLDIATLAAGATHHSADAALLAKLLAAGLLREEARTGYLYLTQKGCALLEENGYTFVPKQGWRLDTAQAVRLLQVR
jgi:hypothetical protein